MTPHVVGLFLSLAWLLGIGLLAARLARRYMLPDLVLFVVVGVLLGPSVMNIVHLPATGDVGQLVVTGGAVFMLYEGGRGINLDVFKSIWLGTALLATFGVVVTAAVVALAAHLTVGVPWTIAMLVGAAIASTDPATIIPLFAQVKVLPRLQQLVVGESAFNDATGSVLTLALLAAVEGGRTSGMAMGESFARLIGVGVASGLLTGLVIQLLVAEDRRLKGIWDTESENVVASLLAMAISFSAASFLGGSGFMAAFIAGIIRGNASRWGVSAHPLREASHETFMSNLATALRILIFGVLGANVSLQLLGRLGPASLAVMAVFLFAARPLAVALSLVPDRIARWSLPEMLFTAWVRETGVVPAALATLLLAAKAPGADTVAAFTFLAVVVTILVQVPTTAFWARRLHVTAASPDEGSH